MSKQTISSKETFDGLSDLSKEWAREVLAHYLRERANLNGAGTHQEDEKVARNIVAAFAALEGVSTKGEVMV
ncbi:hypothetical protein [Halomonas sp. MES3-P3E]|uniref:hypothetical protein n=1 Tax=Halomonas sp. MES3-P3E TaxID=2058321 RepID=UPI000C34C2FF|nr:hypothetical protein [Halomonas sp. MES3-P3E]PKG49593.1 hypothetical protein CXF87_12310 [Halomonas sp. MES3-P3E]